MYSEEDPDAAYSVALSSVQLFDVWPCWSVLLKLLEPNVAQTLRQTRVGVLCGLKLRAGV